MERRGRVIFEFDPSYVIPTGITLITPVSGTLNLYGNVIELIPGGQIAIGL